MRISLITITLNCVDTIQGALDSVHGQSYAQIEHIVVDGKSTDGTIEKIHSYKPTHKIRIVSEKDDGLYDALNKGIEMCTGEIIGILHSDDRFSSPDEIQHIAELFHKHSDTPIIFGDVNFVENHCNQTVLRKYRSKIFRAWMLRIGIMPAHTATFVRKKIYNQYGLYNKNYKISADYERFVRWLYSEKLDYLYTNRVITLMQQGGVSTSGLRSSIILNKEIIAACRDNNLYTNFLFLLVKIPLKLMSVNFLNNLLKKISDN